jgi:hypothetical protein
MKVAVVLWVVSEAVISITRAIRGAGTVAFMLRAFEQRGSPVVARRRRRRCRSVVVRMM